MVCFSKVSIVLAVKKKRIFYVYFNHLMVSRQQGGGMLKISLTVKYHFFNAFPKILMEKVLQ